jgi:hypothetical protein
MYCRDVHPRKDLGPIIFKHDIPANVTPERERQLQKQSSPRDLIDARTLKDVMGQPEKALLGIVVRPGIAG